MSGTYLVQPIDYCLGKTYKDAVRRMFYEYFFDNHNDLTDNKIIRKPSKEAIMNMNIQAKSLITKGLIIKSFKVRGFTVNLE